MHASFEDRTPSGRGAQRTPSLSRSLAAVLAVLVAATASLAMPEALPAPGRVALAVFLLASVAWTIGRWPEASIALAAALAMTAGGAVSEERLFSLMGSELVWLLVGAFVISASLTQCGAASALAQRAIAGTARFDVLAWRATVMIGATAFLVPSTSARAMLLYPLYASLASAIADARRIRALALLFPSALLLTAGASQLGAGAHLIAIEFLADAGAPRIGFGQWVLLAAPIAFGSAGLATFAILRLYLSPAERRSPITTTSQPAPLTAGQRAATGVACATVVGWSTTAWHGWDPAFVGLVGALFATCRPLTGITLRVALGHVEWALVVFVAATLVVGAGLIDTGAARTIAALLIEALPNAIGPSPLAATVAVALLALLAHLVIVSRSARAMVLLPGVALPFAASGALDLAFVAMLCTVGSGFCQTLTVSAKPLAVFAGSEARAFHDSDLVRLSAVLLLPILVLLVGYAWFAWPALGLPRAS